MGTHKFPALEMPLHCGWKERVRDERSMRERDCKEISNFLCLAVQ